MRIKHLGDVQPICGRKINTHELIRTDLGYERYTHLGVKERFRNEKPYRICKNCLKIIAKREGIEVD